MLRFPCAHLALAVTCLAFAACADKESPATNTFPDWLVDSEVVAVVNQQEITGRDLRVYALSYSFTAVDSIYDRIYNLRLLMSYIDRVLLWQEAAAVGVVITDSTVAWYAARLAESMGGQDALDQYHEPLGLTRADMERTIRRDLMVRALIENRVAVGITIDEDDARASYEKNRDRYVEQYGEAAENFENVREQILMELRDRALSAKIENHLRRNRVTAIIEPRFDVGGLTQRESTIFTR